MSELENKDANGNCLGEVIQFSEALEKTKFGVFNYFLIISSGVILANVLLETSAVAYYMPVAHCDLNLTNYRKGLLSAVGYVGIIVSSHLWGFLADTKGRRLVMRPTLLLAFVVTVFSSFAADFWTMLVLRFINGVLVSGGSATVYAYLGEFHIHRIRSRAIMISAFIYGCGALFMPALGLMIINKEWRWPIPFLGITYKPWRLFAVVCGLPGFLAGISLYFLPESPKFLLSIHKEDEAIKVLQKMYKINGGKEELKIFHILPDEEDCKVVSAINDKDMSFCLKLLLTMWNQTAPLFHQKYLRRTMIICMTQFWLYVITNGMFMWYPYIINAMGEFMRSNPESNERLCEIVYAKNEIQANGAVACPDKLENTTYFYSLFMETSYVVALALVGVIINCTGKTFILFNCIIMFCSCGLLAVWLPFTSVSAIFYSLFFLTGVNINVLGGATVELYPTQLRAMAICISLMMGRIGSVVATNIVGAFLSTYCETTFYVASLATMACAFLILFLPRSVSESQKNEKSKVQNIK